MKKYFVQPMYHSLSPRWLTWEEAEEAAYWECMYFRLSAQGMLGSLCQEVAISLGFPVWTIYFAGPKTGHFFVPCEDLEV